jgi:hypothetical protein
MLLLAIVLVRAPVYDESPAKALRTKTLVQAVRPILGRVLAGHLLCATLMAPVGGVVVWSAEERGYW